MAETKVVMATLLGKLEEFDPASDSITAYVERVQLFFDANSMAEGKQVAVFLSVLGSKTYLLLRNLLTPETPKDKTFDELVTVLKEHFEPKPLIISERFHFYGREQAVNESISDYVVELRRLTTHCEFGAFLEDALRDRFVCGLKNETMQRKLLTESDLTFQRALKVAQSDETATAKAKLLQNTSPIAHSQDLSQDICKVSGRGQGIISCYRCGKPDHHSTQCPFMKSKCYKCGKLGHIRSVCRQPLKGQGKYQRGKPIKSVLETSEDCVEYEVLLNHFGAMSDQPYVLDVQLDGKPIRMEIDTGAALSLVSEQTFRSLFPLRSVETSKVHLQTYSGEVISVEGQVQLAVSYQDQKAMLPLVVVKASGPSLIGRNWLSEIHLDWSAINVIQSKTLAQVLDCYRDVFKEELGKLKARIYVDPGAQPHFRKARPVPYATRSKVEAELQRLTEQGILQPVQFADWAAPIVPVLKADKQSIRICGDFKLTVNQASKLDRYPIPRIEDLFAKLSGGQSFTKLDMSQGYQQVELDEDSRKYVTINTYKGLFQHNRLPFGGSSAPGIFQRVMESILKWDT